MNNRILRLSTMDKIDQPSTQADSKPYDLRPSNSSKPPIEPVHEGQGIRFDKDALFYDMSGEKFLIIVNQHTFEETNHFTGNAWTRNGTENDECRLKEVFSILGFQVSVLKDLKYQNIIDNLTAFATRDHRRTSCICVTILTHGDKGGAIFAADKPYPLSELIAIFEKETSLINKPKLFFVQACRGGRMDAGHIVKLSSQSDSTLIMPTDCSSEMLSSYFASEEERLMMTQYPLQADCHFLSCCGLLDLFKGVGIADRSDRRSGSLLTVPTHADILVMRSTVEDFYSYRDKDGSWMIQTLCDVIQNHHENLNLLEMIIQMNRAVAYERTTSCGVWHPMNNKKQMPEATFTLTKQLKF